MDFFKKKSTIILLGILGVILFSMMWFFSVRNSLIIMEEGINGAWAQVENQLQRRYDLIPNLVNTVKGVASHEKEVFTSIANARSKTGRGTNANTKDEGLWDDGISFISLIDGC